MKAFLESLTANIIFWLPSTITAAVSIFIAIFNHGLHKKQQMLQKELEKEIELFRSKEQNKNYVSKVRFDTEFQIYRELTVNCNKMFVTTIDVYPTLDSVPADLEKRIDFKNERFFLAAKAYNTFQTSLAANSPFIPVEIHNIFNEFKNLCKENLDTYNMHLDFGGPEEYDDDGFFRKQVNAALDRNRDIIVRYDELIEKVRSYLASLEGFI